jgi:hypothetical protein
VNEVIVVVGLMGFGAGMCFGILSVGIAGMIDARRLRASIDRQDAEIEALRDDLHKRALVMADEVIESLEGRR